MAKALTGLAAKAPGLIKGVVDYSTPKLNTFWHYARVELTPPTPADIPKITQGLNSLVKSARTGKWKEVPVKEAWLNTLITAEIAFWFFVGECIGKGTIVGYQV
ncbi:hypothetical protein DAPPUDRAFT_230756 [Daphnia pulex]|uniref:ATP synthase subunit g n=1 Tax=Daphnia pulex TaxID=6669 RepID=E9GD06_DAPPU|nr:hypothetical protein DAPPUDRAFT_230756 [Daphnia pulex]|eukprot:EFX82650.1 hypothetical protein DAPPUDRAFT_230756 [Daphnia pulex]